MKKTIILALAALLLVFTQCKKDKDTTAGKTVRITLNVDGDGSKSVINPGENGATVTFGGNDVIHVAYNGVYVGQMKYGLGQFSGEFKITKVGDQPLYFYYLGGANPNENLKIGESTQMTVNIGNQKFGPIVISCGASKENFDPNVTTSYSAKLYNKCALVQFKISSNSSGDVLVYGLNNQVSFDLSAKNLNCTYSKAFEGAYRLAPVNGQEITRWVVLLPQTGLSNGSAYAQGFEGSYSFNNVTTINENDYIRGDNAVTVTVNTQQTHDVVDLGLPSGTLWATRNIGANNTTDYGDYFAWGEIEPYYSDGHSADNPCNSWKEMTTGTWPESATVDGYNWHTYSHTANPNTDNNFYPWPTEPYFNNTLTPDRDAATRIWGNDWRMPTNDELNEFFLKCNMFWKDGTTNDYNKQIGVEIKSKANSNTIFLPAAGYRLEQAIDNKNEYCYYWSSTFSPIDGNQVAKCFEKASNISKLPPKNRCTGYSIRPVRKF